MSDIFHDGTKSIPKKSPQNIVRVDFDKSDLGARASHLKRAETPKNGNTIVHVKGA